LSLATNCGSLESLNWRTRCGAKPWARQMRCTEETLMPVTLAMAAELQWVASCGGAVAVSFTTLSIVDYCFSKRLHPRRPCLVAQEPLAILLQEAFLPSPHASLYLPVRRMISTVPSPSAVNSRISARQTCFRGALRSRTMASNRRRSFACSVMDSGAHAPDSHALKPAGIPHRIQMSDAIH